MTRQLTTEELRIGKVPREEFGGIERRQVCLVLDGVRNASNLGNIFRLADAMLLEKIWLCGDAPLLGKKFIRASKRMDKWVAWEHRADAAALLAELKAAGYATVAMELSENAKPLRGYPFRAPLALVIGGETGGVSPVALALCDDAIYLPMQGMGNSINVSNSVAIAVYEVAHAAQINDVVLRDGSIQDSNMGR